MWEGLPDSALTAQPCVLHSARAQAVSDGGKVSARELMGDRPELPAVPVQRDREQNHLESLGKASARAVLVGQK